MLNEVPHLRQDILSSVPLFLVRISRSYYQNVESVTRSFMNKITQKIDGKSKIEVQNPSPMGNTQKLTFSGFRRNIISRRANKSMMLSKSQCKSHKSSMYTIKQKDHIPNETDVDKLSIADE